MYFFFSSRRRHTRCLSDWSSDVCSSDLGTVRKIGVRFAALVRLGDVITCRARVVAKRPPKEGDGPHLVDLELWEIGRASCRERGEDTGGGSALKKQTSR